MTQVRDDRYEYKVISDDHLDNDFGVYKEYKDGILVPYPARVEGTKKYRESQRSQEDAKADKAAKAAALKEKNNTGTRGRGAPKRRAQDLPEDAPTPKKATRTSARLAAAGLSETGAAKGLLAADEEASAPFGTETPDAEDSTPGSPEPEEGPAANATEGLFLPKSATDADEYGLRSCEWRHDGVNVIHNRFIVPPYFKFGNWEIGFSDSRNSKEHQRKKQAAANPFTGKPNSGAWYFDHRIVDYDSSQLTARSFDQETVAKHGLHPTTGLFLADSKNDQEPAEPYVMPGKPVVYIANPSGRIVQASRSFQVTTTQRSVEEASDRADMRAALHKFCKKNDIDPEALDLTGYTMSDEQLLAKSLGTAELEDQTQSASEETTSDAENALQSPADANTDSREDGVTGLSILTYASAVCQAQDLSRAAPAVAKSSRYDAIRDVFTSSKPDPTPTQDAGSYGMNMLAQICNVEPRVSGATPNVSHAALAAALGQGQTSQATAPSSDAAGAYATASNVSAPDQHKGGQDQTTHHAQQHEATLSTLEPQHEYPAQQRGHALPPPPAQQPDRGMIAPTMPHERGVQQQDQGMIPQMQAQQDSGVMPQMQPQQDSGMMAPMHPQDSRMMPHPAAQQGGAMMPHPDARNGEYLHQQPPHHGGQGIQAPEQHYRAPSFSHPDAREPPYPPVRPGDQAYDQRGMATYAGEAQQPPPQGYGSQPRWDAPTQAGPVPVAPAGAPPHQYPPLAPPTLGGTTPSRIPFSLNASADPLPPLRPTRSRFHLLTSEDTMHEQGIRSEADGYYPQGHHRGYARGYQEPPLAPERILPNPQQSGQQAYMVSPPPQGFTHQQPLAHSPTLGNLPTMPGQPIQQSPPGTPHGSAHHHRSTPSGDAGNGKYRKLQPAPVPAHRAWNNKPELKTILYDPKETGSSAALPSSGPTTIRGWNVNQPRKRSKQDRTDSANDREDSR